jgi:hypothetical protein
MTVCRCSVVYKYNADLSRVCDRLCGQESCLPSPTLLVLTQLVTDMRHFLLRTFVVELVTTINCLTCASADLLISARISAWTPRMGRPRRPAHSRLCQGILHSHAQRTLLTITRLIWRLSSSTLSRPHVSRQHCYCYTSESSAPVRRRIS